MRKKLDVLVEESRSLLHVLLIFGRIQTFDVGHSIVHV